MIRELATYIAAQVPLVLGTTLHVGYFPDDAPDDCSMVRHGGGDVKHRSASYSREDPLAQVITRAEVQSVALAAARAIFDALRHKTNITLPQVDGGTIYHVYTIDAGLPQSIGRDELGRFEYSATFQMRLEEAQ